MANPENLIISCGIILLTIFSTTIAQGAPGPDIPMHLLKELAQIQSTEGVLRRFGGASTLYPVGMADPQALAVQIHVGSGSHNKMRTQPQPYQYSALVDNVPLAENAGCAPTETVIEMPKVNSSVAIHPLGTKVMRCAGICGHSSLQCRPTKTQTFIRKGLILVYKGGNLVPTGHQNFTLENHIACTCDCLQKATDCNTKQRYEGHNCKCVCGNQADMASCGPHRVWDYKECRCKCPNVCSTCPFGMYFDDTYNCACVSPQQSRGRHVQGRRN